MHFSVRHIEVCAGFSDDPFWPEGQGGGWRCYYRHDRTNGTSPVSHNTFSGREAKSLTQSLCVMSGDGTVKAGGLQVHRHMKVSDSRSMR